MSELLNTTNSNITKQKLIIKKVTSFSVISDMIKENTLVLCDIDETVLRYKKSLDDFYKESYEYLIKIDDFFDEEDTKNLALNEFYEYRESNIPFHTDKDGWDKMIDQIEKTNSKLVFITARSNASKNTTLEQLKSVGIESNKYEYHFTYDYKMSKGSYIENFIDINQFDNVFFIDDDENTTKIVKHKHNTIDCYLYKYNK
jgi:hypothetical protein